MLYGYIEVMLCMKLYKQMIKKTTKETEKHEITRKIKIIETSLKYCCVFQVIFPLRNRF